MDINEFPICRVAEHNTNKKVKQCAIYIALISQQNVMLLVKVMQKLAAE
jgi:hypothetical protein